MEGYLDYYAGAYGPTIRLGTESRATLLELKLLLEQLLRGERASLSLADLQGLSVTNIDSLVLRVVEDQPEIALQKLERDTTAFLWQNTPKKWTYWIGMMDGLIESSTPCHQYFSNENIDDALFEVSFQEDAD